MLVLHLSCTGESISSLCWLPWEPNLVATSMGKVIRIYDIRGMCYVRCMVLCTRYGVMYEVWCCVGGMVLSMRYGVMYEVWCYVRGMVLSMRYGAMYEVWCYVRGMVLHTRDSPLSSITVYTVHSAYICTVHT